MNMRWRSLVGVVLIGLAAGLAGGCEDDDPFRDNWKFSNQSSYRVTVEPNGQYWLTVVISPGHSAEVEYDGEHIQFLYSPSSKVWADTSSSGRTIRFYNR